MRILFVEDSTEEVQSCIIATDRYRHERQRDVTVVVSSDFEDARGKLDNSIDGAIIDIRLGRDRYRGNEFIEVIEKEMYRIPVAVLTATPTSVDRRLTYIGVFKKGEAKATYESLFDRFWSIHGTGLTRIMGGRGKIESSLVSVFRKNIVPQIRKWEEYGKIDSARTEKALLRHTLNHLIQLLDEEDDLDHCFPEEFYLFPPSNQDIRTGSILKEGSSGNHYVVMTPDCDLVVRGEDGRNTDMILVAAVLPGDTRFSWAGRQERGGLEYKTYKKA